MNLCGTCDVFVPWPDNAARGNCHLSAPQPTMLGPSQFQNPPASVWPEVDAEGIYSGCSEWVKPGSKPNAEDAAD